MEKTNKKTFINFNNQIVPKPEGIDYDLIPGTVYNLRENHGSDGPFLEETQDFTFPETYYLSEDDNKFVNKTIEAFNRTEKMTTGIMLSGVKGSGKTLMAKKIAKLSGLPIIVIDPGLPSPIIEPFFAKTDTDCCIIFDEIDKYWSTRYLLTFLDGVRPTCKKLVICTCNNEKEIDEYLNDRCSRIRYKRIFKCLDKDATAIVINDIINDEEKAKEARDFLFENANLISYDNVIIFAEEIRNNPNESFESVFEDLNMKKTKKQSDKTKDEIVKDSLINSRLIDARFGRYKIDSDEPCCECCSICRTSAG